jgi:hypothetical protein
VEVSTYHANARQAGKYWHIHVPEVDRVTQARNVREIESMARDLIAIMEDVPADSFDLAVNITLPATVENHMAAAERLRKEAALANARAAVEARAAAVELAKDLPLRDVAILLGVSHQRVHQLISHAENAGLVARTRNGRAGGADEREKAHH